MGSLPCGRGAFLALVHKHHIPSHVPTSPRVSREHVPVGRDRVEVARCPGHEAVVVAHPGTAHCGPRAAQQRARGSVPIRVLQVMSRGCKMRHLLPCNQCWRRSIVAITANKRQHILFPGFQHHSGHIQTWRMSGCAQREASNVCNVSHSQSALCLRAAAAAANSWEFTSTCFDYDSCAHRTEL